MKQVYTPEKERLLVELEHIHDRGIMIFLDGMPSSPNSASEVLCLREESAYMRDYVTDEDGTWKELHFDPVPKKQRKIQKTKIQQRKSKFEFK